MLEPQILEQLKTYLARLPGPVELVVAYDERPVSTELRSLIADVQAASPLVSVREEVHELRPSFGIARPGEVPRVRFAGVPLGHEFSSLVLALLWVAGHPPKVDEALLAQARALPGPLALEAFMSLACHNCPDVVQAATLLAVVNPDVTSTVIDGASFQGLADARNVLAVPTLFANGKEFASGRMGLEELLGKLDAGKARRDAALLSEKAPFDVLVLGGGPAGAAAAVYAARKGIHTGIVTERMGGQVNDTLDIENYISVLHTEGPRLAADLEKHVRAYGVDIVAGQRVARLVPADNPGGLARVELEGGAVISARTVIVAAGARWRTLGVPGEADYRNKGVAFCTHCDGPLFKGKRTVVVGGGNSGVEAAIDLAGIVEHVTLLEYGEKLRADAVLVAKLESLPNVTILTRARTTEILGDGARVTGLRYEDMATGELRELSAAGVFVQIGLMPNTEFVRGVLELSRSGEVVVDARCATGAPGIFAAGDVTTVPYKQIVVAAGEGAKAALSAFDYLVRTPAA